MKTIILLIATVVAVIFANIMVYALPILAVVNFAWLLFNDETLFSWWVLVWVFVGFIISVLAALGSFLYLKISND